MEVKQHMFNFETRGDGWNPHSNYMPNMNEWQKS